MKTAEPINMPFGV